jgi:hypothetical protein
MSYLAEGRSFLDMTRDGDEVKGSASWRRDQKCKRLTSFCQFGDSGGVFGCDSEAGEAGVVCEALLLVLRSEWWRKRHHVKEVGLGMLFFVRSKGE